MLRLFAFLITGFWPSRASLRALRKDVDDLDRALKTLTKKHNTLAGSYYAETEVIDDDEPELAIGTIAAAPRSDFPEERFAELQARKRAEVSVSSR